MWYRLASFILKFRVALLLVIGSVTLFMGYQARQVKIAYNFTQLLPSTDSALVDYQKFRQQFGADGSVMIAGMQVDSLFSNLQEFNDWYDLNYSIKNTAGIKDVISVASLFKVVKNDSLTKMEVKPLLKRKPANKYELDSVKKAVYSLPFYNNFILNRQTGATLVMITFKEKDLNTVRRIAIVDSVRAEMETFGVKYYTVIHYSGMPYIRTVISRKIQNQMVLFFILAIVVTILILFLFFRSLYPVIFPLIIVMVGVIWSFALINILGYQITVLTSIIPALMMVIGVPNCILLLNKYHTEYRKDQNKVKALTTMISKIGISIFLANVTTAIGFAVFCSTRSDLLVQFGLVTSLGVMCTYLISLFLIPIIFSFLPAPAMDKDSLTPYSLPLTPFLQNTRHLESRRTNFILSGVNNVVLNHRKATYLLVVIGIIISLYGISKIKAIGYVVDDLPQNDPIYEDMHYFEKCFGGTLPLEIEIDTRKPKGVFADNGKALYKMERLQKMLKTYPCFSSPLSAPEFVKFANQAYHDGNPKYFIMPTINDLSDISQYLTGAGKKIDMLKPFIDSTKQYTCVNLYMQDFGSAKMKEALASVIPRADSIFNYSYSDKTWLPEDQKYKITFTGSCLIFLKGNDYLVKNLIESILLAVILVSLVLYLLFMSVRMVIISTIPTIIPLIITLGLMGFFNVHLKPSTIIIFSIAFGISSDGTMYFLTKYKQEMKRSLLQGTKQSISEIVSLVIKETGVSMIYTAVILSCGFMIFIFSGFGGTRALGLLVSVTLLMAYASNLIVLPSFIVSLEKRLLQKEKINSVIDVEMEGMEEEDSLPTKTEKMN